MKNYDKSLTEVWEWKEKVYREVKGLTAKEHVEKLRNDAEKILSKSGIKLTPISLEKNIRKLSEKQRGQLSKIENSHLHYLAKLYNLHLMARPTDYN